jgi:hypothetical protein
MAQDRKKKLKRREQQRARSARKKHDLFDDALQRVELLASFRKLDRFSQTKLRSMMFPLPELIIDPSAAGLSETAEICKRFREQLEAPSTCPDAKMTPRQWICVVSGLRHFVLSLEHFLREDGRDASALHLTELFAFGAALDQLMVRDGGKLVAWFLFDLFEELLVRTRLDERVFYFVLGSRHTAAGKPVMQVTLHCRQPAKISIDVDGAPRPAFRCTLFANIKGLQEVSWPASELGVRFGPAEFPVYVQKHVLEQLRRRIPFATAVSVTISLEKPKIIKQSNSSFLVEYLCSGHKLGYFAGNVLADKVLLKTFLFLTMQGTPEADLLYRKLRLMRSDIEYMHLDELSLFSSPAVRKDVQLKRLFEECGCGHLLKLDTEDLAGQWSQSDVETLRKYLGDFQLPSRG